MTKLKERTSTSGLIERLRRRRRRRTLGDDSPTYSQTAIGTLEVFEEDRVGLPLSRVVGDRETSKDERRMSSGEGTIPGVPGFRESKLQNRLRVEVRVGKSNSLPAAGYYNAKYGNFQTDLCGEIRREAFGEDIGQNSWLTAEEQDRFLKWLDLAPGKTLLDLGCGAGVCK